jgi:hypothetical protein
MSPPKYAEDALERFKQARLGEGKFNFGPKAVPAEKPDSEPKRAHANGWHASANGHTPQDDPRYRLDEFDNDPLLDVVPFDSPGDDELGNDQVDEKPAGEKRKAESVNGVKQKAKVFWHGSVDYRASRPQLVQDVIPQVGCGLMSGQWGTFKTFAGFDLAHSCMSGEPFLGYEVVRRGGVVLIGLEGRDEIPIRLQAVIDDRGKITGEAPFAWVETCPPLLGKNAVEEICATLEPIARELKVRFGMPLVLVEIDTLPDAAGYHKDGQESDTTAGQAILNVMAEVAYRMRCFVLGIEHFGKQVETGTRGSSAREGRADVVLAMLGDKSVSGEIKNTRLALRKRRGGANGEEHPFGVRKIEMGVDNRGKPMSTLVIDWGAAQTATVVKAKGSGWPKSLRLLRHVAIDVLADQGTDRRPFADGPEVRACDVELVRQEFCRRYSAEGNEKQKAEARSKAIRRAIRDAQDFGLLQIREVDGVQLVWLLKSEKAEETSR